MVMEAIPVAWIAAAYAALSPVVLWAYKVYQKERAEKNVWRNRTHTLRELNIELGVRYKLLDGSLDEENYSPPILEELDDK